MDTTELDWIKVADTDELPEGRVKTVTARTTSICLVHFDGQWTAMDNHCPHQKGPLGEGTIEKGVDDACWIRCPWRGWDFDPLTGKPPGGGVKDHGQKMFPVDVREGSVFVGLEPEPERVRTVSDVMVETMTNWGVQSVFGMVGRSNLGLADAIRLAVGGVVKPCGWSIKRVRLQPFETLEQFTPAFGGGVSRAMPSPRSTDQHGTVDGRLPTPPYHQVYMILRDKIVSGDYGFDEVVPGEQQATEMFGVSRITAKRALNELAGAGTARRTAAIRLPPCP